MTNAIIKTRYGGGEGLSRGRSRRIMTQSSMTLSWRVRGRDRRRPGNPPDRIPDVIGDEQRSARINGNADGTAHRGAILCDEARQHIQGETGRTAVAEGHENDFVSAPWLAIPRAMLAD